MIDKLSIFAFYYAKKELPNSYYGKTEYKIIQDYQEEDNHLYIENDIIVDYRIAKMKYNDNNVLDGFYTVEHVYKNGWAVIQISNNIQKCDIEDIDTQLIYFRS